ncbi:MAG: hypothetical protein M3Q49_05910 [Actinomycetota bacterium]|nr:hypothetical protein [Actinomycetota bacterium]
MGVRRRLERLEAGTRGGRASLTPERLSRLSDADLDALEAATEAYVERGEGEFEDLFAVAGEQSRRALADYFEAIGASRGGTEEPTEEAEEPHGLDGYRIWKHHRKEAGYWTHTNACAGPSSTRTARTPGRIDGSAGKTSAADAARRWSKP